MTLNRPTADDRSRGDGENVIYVLGDGHLGTALARRLRAEGHVVRLVNESHGSSETPGHRGDPTEIRILEEAGVASASTVVVATQSDSRNLLIAQIVRSQFDVPEVVVLANLPDRIELFADAGHDPVCATSVLSDALVERI